MTNRNKMCLSRLFWMYTGVLQQLWSMYTSFSRQWNLIKKWLRTRKWCQHDIGLLGYLRLNTSGRSNVRLLTSGCKTIPFSQWYLICIYLITLPRNPRAAKFWRMGLNWSIRANTKRLPSLYNSITIDLFYRFMSASPHMVGKTRLFINPPSNLHRRETR